MSTPRAEEPSSLKRLLALVRIDIAPGNPRPNVAKVILATMVSIGGSLLVDALLVAIGTKVFPTTSGYGHFQFSDYGKLTVIGVVIACAAWPIVTRISASPRWLFVRMAVAVTLVLLLPDLYILVRGQPPEAVSVLMVMHVAIGLVTYLALVNIAPTRALSLQAGSTEGAVRR